MPSLTKFSKVKLNSVTLKLVWLKVPHALLNYRSFFSNFKNGRPQSLQTQEILLKLLMYAVLAFKTRKTQI